VSTDVGWLGADTGAAAANVGAIIDVGVAAGGADATAAVEGTTAATGVAVRI
jgi:hypothetical protein